LRPRCDSKHQLSCIYFTYINLKASSTLVIRNVHLPLLLPSFSLTRCLTKPHPLYSIIKLPSRIQPLHLRVSCWRRLGCTSLMAFSMANNAKFREPSSSKGLGLL
jgi:hypothetical protein